MTDLKKELLEELVDKAHLEYLPKTETAIINGAEMTVIPYGYLSQAVKKYAREYAEFVVREIMPERTINYIKDRPKVWTEKIESDWEYGLQNRGFNWCLDKIKSAAKDKFNLDI